MTAFIIIFIWIVSIWYLSDRHCVICCLCLLNKTKWSIGSLLFIQITTKDRFGIQLPIEDKFTKELRIVVKKKLIIPNPIHMILSWKKYIFSFINNCDFILFASHILYLSDDYQTNFVYLYLHENETRIKLQYCTNWIVVCWCWWSMKLLSIILSFQCWC